MSKQIVDFTNENYESLLKLLGSEAPASIPVQLEISNQFYIVRLTTASLFAPLNPIITLEEQTDEFYIFKLTDPKTNSIYNVFVEPNLQATVNTGNNGSFVQEPIEIPIPETQPLAEVNDSKKIKKSSSKLIQAIIDKYGEYPPAEHPQVKYNELILRTLDPQYSREDNRLDNKLDKKITSKLSIKKGQLFNKDGDIFSTIQKDDYSEKIYIWVLDHQGNLYSSPMHGEISQAAIGNQHSFFRKKEGFGKPIACGGHFKVNVEGKITEIDNCSGHYKPTKDQLILAIKFLHKEGVLIEDLKINYFDREKEENQTMSLEEALNINSETILSKYPPLDNYISSKIQVFEKNVFLDDLLISFDNLELNELSGDIRLEIEN